MEIILKKLEGKEYKHVQHKETKTSQESAEIRGTELQQGAKCILLCNQEDFVMATFSASLQLDSKKLKKILKWSSMRFATDEELFEKTKLKKG
jgi:prolyl-tRNA editing enzyme YbaK/EbsC (Cys-tRNA(Pro) deacylase)